MGANGFAALVSFSTGQKLRATTEEVVQKSRAAVDKAWMVPVDRAAGNKSPDRTPRVASGGPKDRIGRIHN